MADGKNSHEASASATGYLYQCRIALMMALKTISLNVNQEVSVERFDDVAFDDKGTPSELVQTKHHIEKKGNLTDASSDLWKTLLIWLKAVKADAQLPFLMKFLLMTTGSAPDGSASSYLRAVTNARNEAEADKLLTEIATSSKNDVHTEAYGIYKELSQEVRLSLLRSITVLDNAANITDVIDEIRQTVYMAAPKIRIANFVALRHKVQILHILLTPQYELSIPPRPHYLSQIACGFCSFQSLMESLRRLALKSVFLRGAQAIAGASEVMPMRPRSLYPSELNGGRQPSAQRCLMFRTGTSRQARGFEGLVRLLRVRNLKRRRKSILRRSWCG